MAGTAAEYFHDGESASGRDAQEGAHRLRRIERLAWVLDRSIPLGNRRFGLDPIIGLLPGLGDWIGSLLSLYVLYEGARLGIAGWTLVRMTWNIIVEAVVGAIPVLGDVFDFAWQANARNIALIHRHYRPSQPSRPLGWVWAAVVIAIVVLVALLAALSYAVIKGVLLLWPHSLLA